VPARATELDDVTIHDYLVVVKQVGIAELKARLSEYVREVRHGQGLLVMDRRTPVARLEPYEPKHESWGVRRPLRRWPSLQKVPLPSPLRLGIDAVAQLLDDRRRDR
jgi:prevent-host-death family protein